MMNVDNIRLPYFLRALPPPSESLFISNFHDVCVCVSHSVALELLYEHGCDYLIEHGQLTSSYTTLPFLAAINCQ